MATSGRKWNGNTNQAEDFKPRVHRDLSHIEKVSIETLQTPEIAIAIKKFRNTTAWVNCQKHILNKEPLCRKCMKSANTVHHIITLEEEYPYFTHSLIVDNLVPLCRSCHGYISVIERKNMAEAKLIARSYKREY